MARSEETLLELPDYDQSKKAPQKARAIKLLQEGHLLRASISEATERLDEIKSELAQIQLANDLPGIRYRNLCFIAREMPGRATLSKELLIDNNVNLAVIEASYKRGNSYIQSALEIIGEKPKKKAEKE